MGERKGGAVEGGGGLGVLGGFGGVGGRGSFLSLSFSSFPSLLSLSFSSLGAPSVLFRLYSCFSSSDTSRCVGWGWVAVIHTSLSLGSSPKFSHI